MIHSLGPEVSEGQRKVCMNTFGSHQYVLLLITTRLCLDHARRSKMKWIISTACLLVTWQIGQRESNCK